MDQIKRLFDKKHRSRVISYLLVIVAYLVIELLMNTVGIKSLFKSLLVPVCCYMIAALALNLTVGISGELSLGHAGFMAIGAFTAVIVQGVLQVSVSNKIICLVLAIIAGGILAGLFGVIISIPVLKLQGDYLAIVTLAFGQIIKSLINNMYLGLDEAGLHFSFVTNEFQLGQGGKMLLSGPMGATGTSRTSTFTVGFILVLFTLFVIYNLMYSKNGRAIMAARDNRIAAGSVGVDVSKIKTLAFVVSATLAGMAGALYALNFATLQPAKFDFNMSIMILVYVVLGGLGNITGTLISTSILYVLPELLRSLQDYRMIIYSLVLIAIMLATNNEKLKVLINELMLKIKPGKTDLKEGE